MTILSPYGPLPKPWWQVVFTMYREMSSFRFYPVTSWAPLKPWWQVLITIFQFYPVTLWARGETVFSKGNSHQVFCYISFSNDEQFSSKFFEESFFCVPNYVIISLQVTSPRTIKTTSLTRIHSNCLQSFILE